MILGFRAAIIADFGQNRKHEDLRASIAADTLKQLGKQAKTASSRRMQGAKGTAVPVCLVNRATNPSALRFMKQRGAAPSYSADSHRITFGWIP